MNARGVPQGLVDSRFELLDRLGGGGMGLVWRARDTVLHREVALKEVRPQVGAEAYEDPETARMLRERVLREARALARLQHPHVVAIHHIVDRQDLPHPWLVMELVSGGSLEDRLERGTLSPYEAIRVGRGVLAGLRAAHAAGVHHRDVKPANVLLREDGTPVLTDFGIAAMPDSTRLTATGDLIGSPEFIAPERISGQEGNPASDLWSLGMMLYVAVEGHSPLRRATSMATLVAVLSDLIPPPVRSGPLAAALSAMLQRNPTLRPDAEQFDRMLAEAEHGSEDEVPGYTRFAAPPPTPPPHVPPFSGSAIPAPQPPGAMSPMLTPPLVAQEMAKSMRWNRYISWVLTVVVLFSVMGWQFVGGLLSSGTGSTRTGSTATATATATPAQNMQTPEGMRTLIGVLRSELGSTKVKSLDVFSDSVRLEAPTQSDPNLYATFDYGNGELRRNKYRMSGTLSDDDVLVDIQRIAWDKLPELLRKAKNDLNMPPSSDDPTVSLKVSPATKQGLLSVWISDDYGVANLNADLNGRVVEIYPRK
jgi:tRNA A-37 threonylcarbamoyl transferase component Bud32